ncbi:unnamed protein product, partial [Ectocarpus sp. 12 AP-2014]
SVETIISPLFGWDATMHWATKAKVWFDHRELVPFVDTQVWLELPPDSAKFTDHHPAYPPTVSLLQLWMALSVGRWSETVINWPWPMMLLSMWLIVYGHGRVLGVSRPSALVFAYFVISLPMVGTHVALAGYADLLLGLSYLAACLCLMDWGRSGRREMLILAVAMALLCTQV